MGLVDIVLRGGSRDGRIVRVDNPPRDIYKILKLRPMPTILCMESRIANETLDIEVYKLEKYYMEYALHHYEYRLIL